MKASAGSITEALQDAATSVATFVSEHRWRPQMAEQVPGSRADDTYVSTTLDRRAEEYARTLLEAKLPEGFQWYSEERGLEGGPDADIVIVADAVDGTAYSHPGRPDWGACCLAAFNRESKCLACVVADLYSPTVFWYDGERDRAFLSYRGGPPNELHIPEPYPRKCLRDGCFIAGVLMRADRLQRDRPRLDRLVDYLAAAAQEPGGLPNPLLGLSFGGSPTIARVAATGLCLAGETTPGSTPRGIDLCFDLVGGRFHDLAGPVKIVTAAGGVALDLQGKDLDLKVPSNSEESDQRHPFVIAATRDLAEEFLRVVRPGCWRFWRQLWRFRRRW